MILLDPQEIFSLLQKVDEESTVSIKSKEEQARNHYTSWEAVERERGIRIGINKATTIINLLIKRSEETVSNPLLDVNLIHSLTGEGEKEVTEPSKPEVPDSVIEETVQEIVALFKILDEYDASNYLGVETTYQLISDLMKWRYQK